MSTRSYDQYCPLARALDLLGERWTLLILRELLGGPRRYGDLRDALPGVATNLLSDRLRRLVAEGLVEQFDVPPPVARTMYRLTDAGWQQVPPVVQGLARFGLDRLPPAPAEIPALSGFLIGVLLGFDGRRTGRVDEDYRVVIDGRSFDFGVHPGGLRAARGEPVVEIRGRARDLVERRVGAAEDVASRIEIQGAAGAAARFLALFGLDEVLE
jgi:DNA-binding HxlR family transcriptional regulator